MKYHKTEFKCPPRVTRRDSFGINCADRKRDTSRTDVRWHRAALGL